MPRNMSFMLTTHQIMSKTKTITRRNGWKNLKPGDILNAVEKGMGLKKGEKINRLCQIRILSTRQEPLNKITKEDLIKEGFSGWSCEDFVKLYTNHNNCDRDYMVNRIEFEYVRKEMF